MTDRVTQRPAPDPYAVLGVTTEASDDDLDHAFRGLVRQHHPDTRPSEPESDADQRLQEILNAYATLRDPVRRAAYDRTRARPAGPTSTPPPRPRFRAAPQACTPIRVGPVHWEPPPVTPTEDHHGR
jgi:curved DNA-binding protein CbpA